MLLRIRQRESTPEFWNRFSLKCIFVLYNSKRLIFSRSVFTYASATHNTTNNITYLIAIIKNFLFLPVSRFLNKNRGGIGVDSKMPCILTFALYTQLLALKRYRTHFTFLSPSTCITFHNHNCLFIFILTKVQ